MAIKGSVYRDGDSGFAQAMRVGRGDHNSTRQIGATATSFTVATPIVRLVCDISCSYVVGGGTATLAATTDALLPAGVVEYVVIDPGNTVGVISATGGNGTLYISEAQ